MSNAGSSAAAAVAAAGQPPAKKTRFTGAHRYRTKFNADWTSRYPFISAVRGEPCLYHCGVCAKVLSCAHQGETDVRRHVGSDSHAKMVSSRGGHGGGGGSGRGLPETTFATPVSSDLKEEPQEEEMLSYCEEEEVPLPLEATSDGSGFPAWLETQGVSAEVARALDSELGIRDYGLLRACVDDGSVRAELLAAARHRLPFGFYAALRRAVKALRQPDDEDGAGGGAGGGGVEGGAEGGGAGLAGGGGAGGDAAGATLLGGLVEALLALFGGLSRELLLSAERLGALYGHRCAPDGGAVSPGGGCDVEWHTEHEEVGEAPTQEISEADPRWETMAVKMEASGDLHPWMLSTPASTQWLPLKREEKPRDVAEDFRAEEGGLPCDGEGADGRELRSLRVDVVVHAEGDNLLGDREDLQLGDGRDLQVGDGRDLQAYGRDLQAAGLSARPGAVTAATRRDAAVAATAPGVEAKVELQDPSGDGTAIAAFPCPACGQRPAPAGDPPRPRFDSRSHAPIRRRPADATRRHRRRCARCGVAAAAVGGSAGERHCLLCGGVSVPGLGQRQQRGHGAGERPHPPEPRRHRNDDNDDDAGDAGGAEERACRCDRSPRRCERTFALPGLLRRQQEHTHCGDLS
ncbi:uncharacterized protein LOC116957627 isoform X2 [Petromyzon marinus]|uniref:uncharacterized protein LOC116957627 isoform X2 n=1 Tax=Petromyzon marinus TaxID=7757 RepID=UPI003F6EE2D7